MTKQDVVLISSIFFVSLGIGIVLCSEFTFRLHRFRLERRLSRVSGDIVNRPNSFNGTAFVSRCGELSDLLLDFLVKKGVWPRRVSSLRIVGNACGAAIVVCAVFLLALDFPWWVGVVSGMATIIVIPIALIRLDQRQQCALFEANLADTVDMIIRMLRAGLPITVALGRVGIEAREPAAAIYREVGEWLEMGLPLSQAMRKVADRIKVKYFDFFVSALTIQSIVGGNLTETLETLSSIIRDRSVSYLKARAVTSQARMTANVILGILPGMLFIMLIFSPGYIMPLLDGSYGYGLISFIVVSYIMALFFIRLIASRVRIR